MKLRHFAVVSLAAYGFELFTEPTWAEEEPLLGQISITAGSYCPRGWIEPIGQLLPLRDNEQLYNLLGCNFGGRCTDAFQLPDLRGRSVVGKSNTLPIGSTGGDVTYTLRVPDLPAHSHSLNASSSPATLPSPAGNDLGEFVGGAIPGYSSQAPTADVMLADGTLTETGRGMPFDIRQPTTVMRFCMATTGLVPQRN